MHQLNDFIKSKGAVIVTLLFILSLLTACGGGGTGYRSQVHHKSSNKHLKGWQKPYSINGRIYQPLLTAKGYNKKGVASWYGPNFHGKKTSNGETYDMHKMTAAHTVLPLGTMVRVKNLETGKKVVVRVNDRGPFVDDRIIDLSYAAAKKLNVVGPGTARVQLTALSNDEDRDAAIMNEEPMSNGFSVQVGSFTDSNNASQLATDLGSLFGSSKVRQVEVNGKRYYRVLAGYFPYRHSAESAKNVLIKRGYSGSRVIALD